MILKPDIMHLVSFAFLLKNEWIKSSFTIMIIMQILSILIALLQAILRDISFSCKSEKVYKMNQFLS